MNQKKFLELVDETNVLCKALLNQKTKEYANEDNVLSHFQTAEESLDCPSERVLWGYIQKHLSSLAKMCATPDRYSQEMWDEKLIDAINYMYLLRGLICLRQS